MFRRMTKTQLQSTARVDSKTQPTQACNMVNNLVKTVKNVYIYQMANINEIYDDSYKLLHTRNM